MHVLVVEDEKSVAELIELALCDIGGFKASFASNGKAGLDKLEQASKDYDILLLDLLLPDLNGWQFLEQIGKENKFSKLPVVLITTVDISRDDPSLDGANVVAVVRKPFDPFTLPQTLAGIAENCP